MTDSTGCLGNRVCLASDLSGTKDFAEWNVTMIVEPVRTDFVAVVAAAAGTENYFLSQVIFY